MSIKKLHSKTNFLPMTGTEMAARGWEELDVLIISGDAYIDHPSFGPAVIGRVLEADGWRVGIIAQPDWTNPQSLTVMGTTTAVLRHHGRKPGFHALQLYGSPPQTKRRRLQ